MKFFKHFQGVKGLIILVILLLMIISYYYYLSHREVKTNNGETKLTLAQELLLKDLEKNYPPTPKEVLKLYGEFSKSFYDKDTSEEEIAQLAAISRQLLDRELVDNQTDEQYLEALQQEIAIFKQAGTVIYDCVPSNSIDVEYFTRNGFEWAKMYCIYTLKTGTEYRNTVEVFLLRKSDSGHWKIFGFQMDE